jgi:predicted nucleotidyltransferase
VPTADAVLSTLAEHRAELRRFGVKRLGLFGSTARGEAGPDSDLDFVVELERLTSDDYFGLLFFLEDALGRQVDLAICDDLRWQVKRRVEQEARYVPGL